MGSILSFARDSLTNLVSRMGTDRDKASQVYYAFTALTDEQLLVAYKTAWLPRKIVDIPAFDSVRAWLDRFLQIVSGAADIPAIRLLSQSPAGMNATGESDLRNYYDRLSACRNSRWSRRSRGWTSASSARRSALVILRVDERPE